MSKPVCAITGVGEGTGVALARRFTTGGYRVAMLARNAGRLKSLKVVIPGSRGYICDFGDVDALVTDVESVCSEMGRPEVLASTAWAIMLCSVREFFGT